ncbi:MAG: Flp pilus assembly complex ATPase component TadA [Pyrinomonadaceae bacterium]|nr:Flp pilus assembly complex ATPase component TadA [Pyrinomonadaceae bacterium]
MPNKELNSKDSMPYDESNSGEKDRIVDDPTSQGNEPDIGAISSPDALSFGDFYEGFKDYTVKELPQYSQFLNKESSARYKAIILKARRGKYDSLHFSVGLVEIGNSDHRNGVVHALKVSPFQVSFQSLEKKFYDELFSQLYNPEAQSLVREHEQKKKSQMTKNWGEGKSTLSPEEVLTVQAISEADFEDEAEEWIELTDQEEYKRNIKRNEAELTTQEFIRLILMEFLRSGASDLHLEAGQPTGRIRFRYDSEMFTRWDNIPFVKIKQLAMGMAETARKDATQMKFRDIDSTIKVRTFRDGQIVEVELRFASQPTLYSPSIVLRSQLKPIRDISDVGFVSHQIADLRAAYEQKRGILVVTGATGSGKTNTLEAVYAALEEPDTHKIIEIGEPIEIRSPRRTQISLRPNTPFSWWDAFYSCLRADPDIIGIGELRSAEHVSVAINAALTGHLVLSTFHAASVEDTMSRMFQMGIPRENLATGINMILAQALVKKLCENCKTADPKPNYEYNVEVYKAVGCPECFNKGTRGRTAMAELLYFNDEVKEWIQNRQYSARDIVRMSREARYLTPMKKIAREKVEAGITSEMEVAGVLGLVEGKRQVANREFADSQMAIAANIEESIEELIDDSMNR